MSRKVSWTAAGLILAVGVSWLVWVQLELPAPTGSYDVGRTALGWVDETRPEPMTAEPDDRREVAVVVWYPAEAGTGEQRGYYPNLAEVAGGLADSGEVSALEVWGLRYVRSDERWQAEPAAGRFPVVVLSPGNATNVEFYAGLAGDLASRGYVVVGLNHPYDVAAAPLSNGRVAVFASAQWPMEFSAHAAVAAARITERTADVRFVLDQLEALRAPNSLAGHLDLERVGILGHSLGGITAAQACAADTRLRACLNLDGLQAGGPFGAEAEPALPGQAFMFITKETALSQRAEALWGQLTGEAYLRVVPGAAHDSFTDGPLLLPDAWPGPGAEERVLAEVRSYTAAFLDHSLRGTENALLAEAAYPHN